MKFRSDINGVRALAVLPVLFFHAGICFASGGYLGVDVFFVISGYLITEKLMASLDRGSFTFAGFYDNRIRRIIPALIVVCLCTTVGALIFMLPYSLKNYGQSLVATLLSANNILLYVTSGYWSLASQFKPLFHTWSLGVEEQYYFAAPLLLYLLYKIIGRSGNALRACLLILLMVSFGLTLVNADKELKFLIIVFRAWELLAGALLALAPKQTRGNWILAAFGLLLMLTAYTAPTLLTDNQALVIAVPIIGACLIIRYSRPDNLVGRFLSFAPLAAIGLISYSVYLWHQPIMAFVRLASSQQPSHWKLLGYSLLSLPLAFLSWRYVENVFRDKTIMPARRCYAIVGAGAALILMSGYVLNRTYGLQQLWPQFTYGVSPQIYVEEPQKWAATSFHDNGKPRILVIGNSFARDYVNLLRESGRLDSMDMVYLDDYGCSPHMSKAFEELVATSDLIVFAKNWIPVPRDDTVNEVYACYRYMRRNSHGRVVVLGVKNFGWSNDFVRLIRGDLRDIRVTPLKAVTGFNDEEKRLVGSDFVDVLDVVADSTGKVPVVTSEGRFITYDTNHLTKAGAEYLGTKLFAKYKFLVGDQ